MVSLTNSHHESSTGDAEKQRTHIHARDDAIWIKSEPAEQECGGGLLRLRPQDAEILFWQLADWLGHAELIPEWEVGVREADDHDCWSFFHPKAPDPLTARLRAVEEAEGRHWDDPEVYQVNYVSHHIEDHRFQGRFDEERWVAWLTEDYQEFMEAKA